MIPYFTVPLQPTHPYSQNFLPLRGNHQIWDCLIQRQHAVLLNNKRHNIDKSEFIHLFIHALSLKVNAYSTDSNTFISLLPPPIITTHEREYFIPIICLPAMEERNKGNISWQWAFIKLYINNSSDQVYLKN